MLLNEKPKRSRLSSPSTLKKICLRPRAKAFFILAKSQVFHPSSTFPARCMVEAYPSPALGKCPFNNYLMRPFYSLKRYINRLVSSHLFNYRHPFYWGYLYDIARRYVSFYRGDENADMYTNGEFRFLRALLTNNEVDVIFDVGANVGDYARQIVDVAPRVNLHCFEPDPQAFAQLKHNLPSTVVLNQVALGEAEANKQLYIFEDGAAINSLYKQPYAEVTKSIAVRVISLDDYCSKNFVHHITLLKIDPEGHELSVLRGATRMLQDSAIDLIQFEYGYAAVTARVFFKDLLDLLENSGFVVYKLKPSSIDKVIYTPEINGCPCANFLAVSKKSTVKGLL
jgi:FkbM family methyltransferase